LVRGKIKINAKTQKKHTLREGKPTAAGGKRKAELCARLAPWKDCCAAVKKRPGREKCVWSGAGRGVHIVPWLSKNSL